MNAKSLVRISLFSALTAILSQISIPIGPVPISLGTFAVYLTAVFLTPKEAFYSQVVYLILGIIGIPVFSGFGSGLSHLMGYTGGFAISYPIVAFICSLSVKYYRDNYNTIILFLGFIFATLVCYLFGVLWFSNVTKIDMFSALYIVVYPFILSDLIKITISIFIAKRIESN